MDDFYDDPVRGRLLLVRSGESETGWKEVLGRELAGGRWGYRVKMNTDPENTIGQTYIKGNSRGTAREAAIWRAQYIFDNPFPAKRPETTKVRPARCPKPCNPLTDARALV